VSASPKAGSSGLSCLGSNEVVACGEGMLTELRGATHDGLVRCPVGKASGSGSAQGNGGGIRGVGGGADCLRGLDG
jgi:hypothetical protein